MQHNKTYYYTAIRILKDKIMASLIQVMMFRNFYCSLLNVYVTCVCARLQFARHLVSPGDHLGTVTGSNMFWTYLTPIFVSGRPLATLAVCLQ